MKRVIVLFVVVLLLGGGGTGAAYYLGLFDEPAAAGEAAAAPALSPDSVFMTLDSFTIPIIRDGDVVLEMWLAVTLELADESAETAAEHALPRLTAEFLDRLRRMANHTYDQGGRRFDTETVKAVLLAVGQQLLGTETLLAVLLQSEGNRAQ